jgi:hypothetical protein
MVVMMQQPEAWLAQQFRERGQRVTVERLAIYRRFLRYA